MNSDKVLWFAIDTRSCFDNLDPRINNACSLGLSLNLDFIVAENQKVIKAEQVV